jgi:hypothetical protein
MVLSSTIISQGCDSSSDSDDDLIGNWKKVLTSMAMPEAKL